MKTSDELWQDYRAAARTTAVWNAWDIRKAKIAQVVMDNAYKLYQDKLKEEENEDS